MKTWVISAIVFLAVVGVCIYGFARSRADGVGSMGFDPKTATYLIAGDRVTLGGGGSGSVEAFGEASYGDVNADGTEDAALFLVQKTEGSGTFYYAVAALNERGSAVGTTAVFLGDRIAPQTISVTGGTIVATYADRAAGEPMTTPPSVGIRRTLMVQNLVLQDVAAHNDAFTYVTSSGDAAAYCDGARMDSDGYRATLTVEHAGTMPEPNFSVDELLRATIDAATAGACHDLMANATMTEKNGTVTVSGIDGFAGISIAMCRCVPEVEVNALRVPGIQAVVWSE